MAGNGPGTWGRVRVPASVTSGAPPGNVTLSSAYAAGTRTLLGWPWPASGAKASTAGRNTRSYRSLASASERLQHYQVCSRRVLRERDVDDDPGGLVDVVQRPVQPAAPSRLPTATGVSVRRSWGSSAGHRSLTVSGAAWMASRVGSVGGGSAGMHPGPTDCQPTGTTEDTPNPDSVTCSSTIADRRRCWAAGRPKPGQ